MESKKESNKVTGKKKSTLWFPEAECRWWGNCIKVVKRDKLSATR